MNIAVCINHVPDTASRIDVQGGCIDRSRLNMVLNPYDEYALEEAARLREADERVRVTVFSAGEESRVAVMRKALAFGADAAVLARGPEPSHSRQAAVMLVRAMEEHYGEEKPDLVVCGRESVGMNRGEVPYFLASLLGVGIAGRVVSLDISGRDLRLLREADGGTEALKGSFPLVVTAEKGLNHPRKTGIKAVMKAKKMPVGMIDVQAGDVDGVRVTSLQPIDRTRSCRMVDKPEQLVPVLIGEW